MNEEPVWNYSSPRSLTIGYGRLHLFPEHAIGQWFCLDRKTGAPLWEGTPCPADDVVGVSEGVIVATESRASGASMYTFGAFGISLKTGQLLWESHFDRPAKGGLWSRILKLFPIECIDHAIAVRGAECLTARGRVLDIHTGKHIRYEASTGSWPVNPRQDDSPGYRLYCREPVECAAGRILRHGAPENPARDGSFPDGTFRLFLADAAGSPVWTFDLAKAGHFINGNYFSYRFAGRWIYMIVSNRPKDAVSDSSQSSPPGDGEYFLWTLEIETGQVCQKIRLAGSDVKECSIDDLDERALLIRCGASAMLFLRRSDQSGGLS